jgi:methyl-accepting chemotaxis protein
MSQQSVSSSEEILVGISQTSEAVTQIAKQAQSTSELAEKLVVLTNKFKIN